ncbi:putative nucleic acid-binding protein [Variovorax paradoxus]|uniref:type II toxin-antitoxin system VapC family toxin n=1 Tax=Variovorax paradoxus TaxID=34073 RepID=UPI00278DC206|nr:PIN domain-containing protein [Variovorax paradoxus]MDQ0572834.1 putative nucleic acid-binding protein [Variovorax paradoxus]
MSAILLDTSYLISLADPARAHHQTAVNYLREALRRGVPLYLSAVAASEFQVKQAVTDLPLRNFEVLPFNIDHAMTAGLLMRDLKRDADDNRSAVKDDIKLIAQAICESLTHVLTEDAQTLVKYLRRLNKTGTSTVQPILLADGFDSAWFDNGQRGLLSDLKD